MAAAINTSAALRESAGRLRDEARILQLLARDLDREADAIEHEVHGNEAIGGLALRDAAAAALAERGALHYTQLAELIEERTEQRIRGNDGPATLLAAIGRDDRFERVGRGIWVLRDREGRV